MRPPPAHTPRSKPDPRERPARFAGLAGLLVLLLAQPAGAQPVPVLSDEAQISLITVLPGDALYSAFGHSAFRVYDPSQGIDLQYNYGTFDFSDPFFLPRFVYGKLDYFLSVTPFPREVRVYSHDERRAIIEQELNLNAVQRQAIFAFLAWNALEENRTYRYDFLYDNCSTRLRDVLQETLRDAVRFTAAPVPEASFRRLLDPYVADRPFLDLGFDLMLGASTDQVPTPRQAMFLPLDLMEAFDRATVEAEGIVLPLVARRDTVFWIEGAGRVETAWPWPALLGWSLLVLGAAATTRGFRGRRPGRRWPDVLLFGTVGGLGMLLVFMWLGTLHTVTNHNWNLLWAWPSHLLAAIMLACRPGQRWLRRYLLATAAVTLGVVLGWPAWPQDLPPAALPLAALLAVRSGWLAYAYRPHTVLKQASL